MSDTKEMVKRFLIQNAGEATRMYAQLIEHDPEAAIEVLTKIINLLPTKLRWVRK